MTPENYVLVESLFCEYLCFVIHGWDFQRKIRWDFCSQQNDSFQQSVDHERKIFMNHTDQDCECKKRSNWICWAFCSLIQNFTLEAVSGELGLWEAGAVKLKSLHKSHQKRVSELVLVPVIECSLKHKWIAQNVLLLVFFNCGKKCFELNEVSLVMKSGVGVSYISWTWYWSNWFLCYAAQQNTQYNYNEWLPIPTFPITWISSELDFPHIHEHLP